MKFWTTSYKGGYKEGSPKGADSTGDGAFLHSSYYLECGINGEGSMVHAKP